MHTDHFAAAIDFLQLPNYVLCSVWAGIIDDQDFVEHLTGRQGEHSMSLSCTKLQEHIELINAPTSSQRCAQAAK